MQDIKTESEGVGTMAGKEGAVRERGGGAGGVGGGDEGDIENSTKGVQDRTHAVYQGMAALSVAFGGMLASMAMGYTSPALPSMRADPSIEITTEEESWIGAVMPLAALFGSVVAGPLVDTFGRRFTLLHLTWPFCLCWAVIATAGGVGEVVAGRVVCGVCVGVQAVAGSVFMPEMVEVELRNMFGAFPAFLGNLGMLLSFAVGQVLSWRGLAWLGAGLSLLPVPLLVLLTETPHYLTSTGQREASLKALRRLRESGSVAEQEQLEIEASAASRAGQQRDVSVWELARAPNLWPVGVAVGLMVAQQTTGITAVVFFASSILAAGGEGLASSASVVLGATNMLGTFVGIYCVVKMKRRDSLLWSTYGVVTALLVLAGFFWAKEAGGEALELANRLYLLPVVALLAYMLCFSVAWGPVPWVFLGEGLPSQVRGKATSVVVAVNWASAFVITKTFAWSLDTLGSAATFFAYAVVTAAAAIVLRPAMPETFGRSATEMDKVYLEAATKKQQ